MKKLKVMAGIICVVSLAGGCFYYTKIQEQRDQEPPVLSADAEVFSAKVAADDQKLISGVTAYDQVDGDVSDSILIDNITKKEGTDSDFLITYVAFDKSSNMASLTRTLHYSDFRQAHFSVTQPLRFPENQTVDLLSYFTADDCIDGDVTSFITLEGEKGLLEDEPKKGIYEYTLSVTDSVGYTTTLPIEVEIYEDTYDERIQKPQIYLNQYIVYMDKGETLDVNEYLDHIEENGTKYIDTETSQTEDSESDGSQTKQDIPVSDIQITSNVDAEKEGIYRVSYCYTSKETGYDCNTSLIVVVE